MPDHRRATEFLKEYCVPHDWQRLFDGESDEAAIRTNSDGCEGDLALLKDMVKTTEEREGDDKAGASLVKQEQKSVAECTQDEIKEFQNTVGDVLKKHQNYDVEIRHMLSFLTAVEYTEMLVTDMKNTKLE